MFLLLVFPELLLTTKNKPIGFTGWKAGWARLGRIDAISVLVALLTLMGTLQWVEPNNRLWC